MNKTQLKVVVQALTGIVKIWNEGRADEERCLLYLILGEDGSGAVCMRQPDDREAEELYTFRDLDGLAAALFHAGGDFT